MNIRGYLISLAIILFHWSAYDLCAQSYTADIRRISVEDGLPNRFVTDVFQDSYGFVWVSTQHGLARFDGYEFVNFDIKESRMTSNSVSEVFEDDSKRLWVKYTDHSIIDVIDLKSLKIMRLDELMDLPFEFDLVHDIRGDGKLGIILSIIGGDIYKYKSGFDLVYHSPAESTYIVHADSEHLLLQLGIEEVLRINISGQLLGKYHFQNRVYGIGTDKTNNIWISEFTETDYLHKINSTGKLEQVDLDKVEDKHVMSSSLANRNVKISPRGYLVFWFRSGVSSQMFVSDPEKGGVIDLQDELKKLSTYGTASVKDIFFDLLGRIWLGTDDGLFIVNVKENKFKTFLSENGGRSTRGMVKDDLGNLYVNTVDENVIIDSLGNVFPSDTRSYGLGAIKGLKGSLWFSNHNGWVEKHNPNTQEVKIYKPKNREPKFWSPWSIFQDKTGNIWLGASRGLFFIKNGSDEIDRVTDYQDWTQVGENFIYHLTETEEGLWLSSKAGLYLMNREREIVEAYTLAQNPPFKIPDEQIFYHHIDDEGFFWLGTNGGGLIRLDRKSGNYRQFTTSNGLSDNVIYAVYEDEFNQLWLPSNKGLMQFDKNNFRVKTYDVGDGIAHNEFNTSAHYRDDEGLFYFGGLKGITMFDPKDFLDANSNAEVPLQIISAQVLKGARGGVINKTLEVINEKSIALKPSYKSLILDFSLLNYEPTYQNNYAYWIEGIDNDWNYFQSNSLRLNRLPYGTHRIQIRGRGPKGLWSSNEISLELNVQKPIYLEIWFLMLLTVSVVAGIVLILKKRIGRLKRDQSRLQRMVDERTKTITHQMRQIEQQTVELRALDKTKSRFFANVSHELRTPLTLILGYLGSVLNDKEYTPLKDLRSGLSVCQKNGSQLLNLTEEILDLAKLESGQLKLSTKPISLYGAIRRLMDGYVSRIVQNSISFSLDFNAPKELALELDVSKFDKVLNNLLSNAVKFTDPDGRISVRLNLLNQHKKAELRHIEIIVTDTGRGIHQNDLPNVFDRYYQSERPDVQTEGGAGIGLALAKELTELMGGNLSVTSVLGKGSDFVFRFKAKEALLESGTVDETSSEIYIKDPIKDRSADFVKKSEGSKTKVLLVEDHPDMRRYVSNILSDVYEVVEAVDGVQALEILKYQQFSLIVTDLMMPRLDGFSLLKEIRGSNELMDLPIMMLTARAANEDLLTAFQVGVDDYLTKPFQPTELMARAMNLLKNRTTRLRATEAESLKPKNGLTTFDQEFVKKAKDLIEQEIENTNFGVIDMAKALGVSQRQLTRKVQRTVGLPPLQFIREIRLQTARKMLESQDKENVSEVMYAVGIRSTGYFAKIYLERFGKKPSAYFQRPLVSESTSTPQNL